MNWTIIMTATRWARDLQWGQLVPSSQGHGSNCLHKLSSEIWPIRLKYNVLVLKHHTTTAGCCSCARRPRWLQCAANERMRTYVSHLARSGWAVVNMVGHAVTALKWKRLVLYFMCRYLTVFRSRALSWIDISADYYSLMQVLSWPFLAYLNDVRDCTGLMDQQVGKGKGSAVSSRRTWRLYSCRCCNTREVCTVFRRRAACTVAY